MTEQIWQIGGRDATGCFFCGEDTDYIFCSRRCEEASEVWMAFVYDSESADD